METVLEARSIVTRFGADTIHDGVSFAVQRGQVVALIGGSGTGKSVLLKEMIGLQRPTGGRVSLFGTDVWSSDDRQMNALRRRFGMLFQDGALFSSLTVAENIEVPMREFLALSESLMMELAGYKVAMVGLPQDAAPKFPSELSGGMRKRAGLARALALDPQLLFLDEPTAGLDPIGAAAFDDLIKGLREALGLTVFLITHDLDTLHAICDRIAVIADKKVLAVGTIAELMAFDHPWVQSYFRGPRARAALGTSESAAAAAAEPAVA